MKSSTILHTIMTNRKPPESTNRLVLAQQYELIKYTEKNYVEFKLLDTPFATKASEELGFPVTAGNIQGCREALGLISNRDLFRAEKKAPKNRLQEIEQRLEKLESMAKELGWKI